MKKDHFLCCLLCLCAILLGSSVNARVPGMYGAEGWAASTGGGRGGTIIRVTNLNASGAGSLSDAIKKTGARIIVFEVGGVINLNGTTLNITRPYVTVAGQTAPSPGITLINGKVDVSTHDVILQHIMIRPGASGHDTGWEPDGLSTVSGHYVVIDHCSFSWAVDENCSASGSRFTGETVDEWRMNTSHDVTMSNNIIAEGLAYATHSKGLHSMGSLIHDNVTNVAVLRNLYSCNNARNPLFKAGAAGVVVNNYIYNPGSSGVRYALAKSEWEGHTIVRGKMSVIGNIMQLGPSSKRIAFMQATNSPCSIYMSDNIAKDTLGNDLQQYYGDATNIAEERPIWNDNITVMDAASTKEYVLNHAGARPWDRDAVDTRIINDARNGTGAIINYETEVGGYPAYESTSAAFKEEQWNLDYMLPIIPEIELSLNVQADTLCVDSVYVLTVNVPDSVFGNNFIELLVNDKSFGEKNQPPYSWSFQPDSAGEYKFIVVAEKRNLELQASKTITVQVIDQSAGVNVNRSLAQEESVSLRNYPNPFDRSTTIEYYLPKAQNVSVSVHNFIGQEIGVLYKEEELPGKHRIRWNPGNIPSGIYFIVLTSDTGVFYHKVMFRGDSY